MLVFNCVACLAIPPAGDQVLQHPSTVGIYYCILPQKTRLEVNLLNARILSAFASTAIKVMAYCQYIEFKNIFLAKNQPFLMRIEGRSHHCNGIVVDHQIVIIWADRHLNLTKIQYAHSVVKRSAFLKLSTATSSLKSDF